MHIARSAEKAYNWTRLTVAIHLHFTRLTLHELLAKLTKKKGGMVRFFNELG